MRTAGPIHLGAALAVSAAAAMPTAAAAQNPPREVLLEPQASFDAAAFSGIRGVHELTDGTLLVSDQRERALYRVDFEAGTRTQVGRNGAGPHEYETPISLNPFRGDSILLHDLTNGRLAVLDPETGEVVRFEPLSRPGLGFTQESDGLGHLFADNVSGVRIAKRTDPSADRAYVLRYDLDTDRMDTVAVLAVPGPPNAGPVPAWDEWEVGADGWVSVVRNTGDYRLDRYGPTGQVLRGPVVPDPPIELNRADRDSLSSSRQAGAAMAGRSRPRRPDLHLPDHFPPARYGGVWALPDGRTLVDRYQHLSEPGRLLDVFDGSGRRVARWRLPAGRELVGASDRWLYAIRRNEYDLQWLERFPLRAVDGR